MFNCQTIINKIKAFKFPSPFLRVAHNVVGAKKQKGLLLRTHGKGEKIVVACSGKERFSLCQVKASFYGKEENRESIAKRRDKSKL